MSLYRVPPACCEPAIEYGSSVSQSISPVTDVDFLAFQGSANSTVRVVLQTSGYYDDPWLRIIDPTDQDIYTNYCSGGSGGCSFYVDQPLSLDGTYHLMVADAGDNDTFSYSISLHCLGGSCPTDLPPIGENYGAGSPNSVGPGAVIEAMGSDLVAYNQLTLRATGLPPNTPALFILGSTQVSWPLGSGIRLVGGSLTRLGVPVTADLAGNVELSVDLASLVAAGLVGPGVSSNFQCWYRDTVAGPTSNLSDAVHVDWH